MEESSKIALAPLFSDVPLVDLMAMRAQCQIALVCPNLLAQIALLEKF